LIGTCNSDFSGVRIVYDIALSICPSDIRSVLSI
jgi:hypothetical protein